jgi:hypothetical protein
VFSHTVVFSNMLLVFAEQCMSIMCEVDASGVMSWYIANESGRLPDDCDGCCCLSRVDELPSGSLRKSYLLLKSWKSSDGPFVIITVLLEDVLRRVLSLLVPDLEECASRGVRDDDGPSMCFQFHAPSECSVNGSGPCAFCRVWSVEVDESWFRCDVFPGVWPSKAPWFSGVTDVVGDVDDRGTPWLRCACVQ